MDYATKVLLVGLASLVFSIGCFIYANQHWLDGQPPSFVMLSNLVGSGRVSVDGGVEVAARYGFKYHVYSNAGQLRCSGLGNTWEEASDVCLTDLANIIKDLAGNLNVSPAPIIDKKKNGL